MCKSRLDIRNAYPRPLQTLFPWHWCKCLAVGSIHKNWSTLPTHPVDSMDVHRRQFCTYSVTVLELIAFVWITILTTTFIQEVSSSLLKIVRFDVWIRQMVLYNTMPLGVWTQSTLNALDNEEKRSRIDDNSNENRRPKKKDVLVNLDRPQSSTIHHTEIQWIDKDFKCLLYALLVHSTSLNWLWQERVYFF